MHIFEINISIFYILMS